MPQTSLYDEDILLWSEQQADVVRRLGQTRRDLPNDFDVENVAEEIESVGRSELASVESFVRLLFLHLMKIAAEPASAAAPHWKRETWNFAAEALTRFAPSMVQRLDIQRAWRLARSLAIADAGLDAAGRMRMLPKFCPFSLDELVREPFDLESLLSRLNPDR